MQKAMLKTVVFLSNYFNHHQKPFSEAMYQLLEKGYMFVETSEMTEDRIKLGWGEAQYPKYVLPSNEFCENSQDVQKLINEADLVIFGSAPYSLIEERLKSGKLTFIYSERIYKQRYQWYKFPIRFVEFWKKYGRYKNAYLLCASAYAAADYAKTYTFCNKSYKWGYFPETKKYDDIHALIAEKASASILWAARLIDLKHPECVLEVAKRLQSEGYQFELNMIGNGVLEEQLRASINAQDLNVCVHLLGGMKPAEVRRYMEQSEIFLFTSDRNEGWGAVLNESMNSACAVVASHAIGSVPFMIEDGKNGLIYQDGDVDDLYQKIKHLLHDHEARKALAYNAYQTVTTQWNAENAVQRLMALANSMINGSKQHSLFEGGVCSEAKKLKDNWYRG